MNDVLGRASRLVLDLLYPPQCAICGRGGSFICDGCAAALPVAAGVRCARCWMPGGAARLCAHCLETPPAFASIRAAYVMDGGARHLAHELKYSGMTALARPMAELIARHVPPGGADLVLAVPLHRGRERSRGYNQASLLAKALANLTGLPFDPSAVRRIRPTAPLAKTMHREERRAIVAGAFVARPERVEGHRLLLVDDVVTTGATLDACARSLLDAGATNVRCVTWARAD